MAFKQDVLIKQWMEREKAAVDYGRMCDKRIAELESQVADLRDRLKMAAANDSSRRALESQLESLSGLATSLRAEIAELRAQLSQAAAMFKTQDSNVNRHHLVKLEMVADMAQAGLAEELRIVKKPEPSIEDSLLVSDGEDLVPPRWLALKRALQALQAPSLLGLLETREKAGARR